MMGTTCITIFLSNEVFVTAPLNILNYLPENHGTTNHFLLQIIVHSIILERKINRLKNDIACLNITNK